MTQASPHIWVPQRNPLWYPSSSLRAADGSPLPYTLDDVAGRPLDPSEYASLLAEIRDCTKIGKGVALGTGVKIGKASSASTPLTLLGSAVKLWSRADDPGITIGTGISGWPDLSGNGHHWAQAVGASQPAFEASGYAGQPSVLFDGVDDYLFNTSLAATLPGGTDTPFSLYLPVQVITAVTCALFGAGNSGAANPNLQFFYNSVGPAWGVAKRDSAGVQKVGGGGAASTSRTLLELHFNGTNSCVIAVDGVEAAPFDLDVGITTLNRLSLGALVRTTTTSFSHMRTPEVVLADAVSSAGERTSMRAYFAARYP